MRALVQRVTHAQVDIDGKTVGSCERGYLILLGVGADDGPDQIERLWSKIFKLRIFEDENGKTNRSLADVETGRFGAMMQISLVNDGPFTIWLDTDQL